ncbi:MarR family winged helix-turn-helix transcriptional regulator [Campylobacter sp. 7477a]|uniref:MarR family winged helix-turn-helix transcriptional regulator n=1 Tax=Campylobacter sp. 7477a TaxID=2735741 RepID=UPI003014A23B|nr:winged helix-turn-helix transcriptional regulator [Campylobacter sp. 7477a]
MNKFDILGNYNTQIEDSIETCIKNVGFSYNEFALFYTLYFSDDGKCTQKQVSDEWFLPKQTVFNICKEYREKGWIELTQSSKDKRERIVCLTSLGKTQVEPAMVKFIKINESAFSKFGEKKSARLFALLDEFSDIYKKQVDNMSPQ